MKVSKAKKYIQVLSLALIMCSTSTYANVIKTDSLVEKKQHLLNVISGVSKDLNLDPEVVLATYIELGGVVLDTELDFRVSGNSWGEDALINEAKKIANKKLNISQNTTISDDVIDDIRYITYNNADLEKECIDIYSGKKTMTSNVRLQLKQSYLRLGESIYI